MAEQNSPWSPIPFGMALSGHLVTGVLTSVGMLAALAASRWLLSWHSELARLIPVIAVSWLVTETLSTLVDQWQSRVHQHDSPGGWIVSVLRVVVYVGVYAAAGFAILRDPVDALWCACVALVVVLIEILLLRPWQPGPTRADVRAAWDETGRMTRKLLSEDDDAEPRPALTLDIPKVDMGIKVDREIEDPRPKS